MTLELPRRKFLIGLASLIAAPAVAKASSLMPVKAFKVMTPQELYNAYMSMRLETNKHLLDMMAVDTIVYGRAGELKINSDLNLEYKSYDLHS